MFDHLLDSTFLLELDRIKTRTQHIKMTVLDFDERPIQEIQGTASSGTVTISGSSSVRRTLNLSMYANGEENDLTSIDSLISINKKIKIWIGLDNPLKDYQHYGEIVWFKCGIFVITSASLSLQTNSCSISIQGQDKMCLLNGSVAGTLGSSVTFHEYYEYDEEGNLTIGQPTMANIIREAVYHLGGEDVNKIFVNDLDDTARISIKYNNTTPIWFSNNYASFLVAEENPDPVNYPNKHVFGEDVGYMPTDFTYPGELICAAGESICSMLDKIAGVLGNYEYYYDLDGNFIFQEKRNYLNTSYTPITEIGGETYIADFSGSKYVYSLTDTEQIASISNSPNYSEVKNDFVVWGAREISSDVTIAIRYHLAVDEKPTLNLVLKNMFSVEVDGKFVRYDFSVSETPVEGMGETWTLIGLESKTGDWREELYRQALVASYENSVASDYDAELLAEWRDLYDTMNDEWKESWEEQFGAGTWDGWNPAVVNDPGSLKYWLDFIDSTSAISQYSVSRIGRRTKVVNNTDITSIYNVDPEDVIFFENPQDADALAEIVADYRSQGQSFCMLTDSQVSYFATSGTGASAYDEIRNLLFQHLVYNTAITLSCIPIYYLEPNNLIYVYDEVSGVKGSFIVTNMTMPLNHTGTMTVTGIEALTRV